MIAIKPPMKRFKSLSGLHSAYSITVILCTVFIMRITHAAVPAALDLCADSTSKLSQSMLPKGPYEATKELRVRAACELREVITAQYSLYDQKERRLKKSDGTPFSSNEHLEKCVNREAQTEDTSDLHFMDRLKQCIAGFKDTHLHIDGQVSVPAVFSGISVQSSEGKYYISAIRPTLLDYLKEKLDPETLALLNSSLQRGNEILEIDGQKPADLVAYYSTFISGSSESFIRARAEYALFSREFSLPTRGFVSLKILAAEKPRLISLPWWAGGSAKSRKDAMDYFKSVGIPLTERVKIAKSKENGFDMGTFGDEVGYSLETPLFSNPFAPLVTFFTQSGETYARMGEVNTKKGSFCYFQLLSFEATDLFTLENGRPVKKRDGLLGTLREFLSECQARDQSLVFDLRLNGGGSPSIPPQILSLLLNAKETSGSVVNAFRVTPANARLEATVSDFPEFSVKDLEKWNERVSQSFETAFKLHPAFTDIIPEENITADPKFARAFTGKVFALVTPYCISACDIMSALLKRSGRATLIGNHSNGTGAGFHGTPRIGSGVFNDPYHEFSIRIPNFLFGVAKKPVASLEPIPYLANEEEFLLENRPTAADIYFEPGLKDFSGVGRSGWETAVLKAMNMAPLTGTHSESATITVPAQP